MTTVNFGTSAHATAITSFAPSRAIPPSSYSLPTMNPVMFCRKTSGIAPLACELDEVRALLGRLGEQDAAVREDPDGMALDAGEPADERVAVERLELVERLPSTIRAITSSRSSCVAEVLGDEAVEVGRVDDRRLRRQRRPRASAAGRRGCATIWRAIASACSSEVA